VLHEAEHFGRIGVYLLGQQTVWKLPQGAINQSLTSLHVSDVTVHTYGENGLLSS